MYPFPASSEAISDAVNVTDCTLLATTLVRTEEADVIEYMVESAPVIVSEEVSVNAAAFEIVVAPV